MCACLQFRAVQSDTKQHYCSLFFVASATKKLDKYVASASARGVFGMCLPLMFGRVRVRAFVLSISDQHNHTQPHNPTVQCSQKASHMKESPEKRKKYMRRICIFALSHGQDPTSTSRHSHYYYLGASRTTRTVPGTNSTCSGWNCVM